MTTYYTPSPVGLKPATAWGDDHPCDECGWTAGAHDEETGACPAPVDVSDCKTDAAGLDLAPDDPRLDDCERMVELWSDYLRASTDFERGYAQGRFEEYAAQNAIDPDLFPALRFEAARRLDAAAECRCVYPDKCFCSQR